jgi:hypothetical protein
MTDAPEAPRSHLATRMPAIPPATPARPVFLITHEFYPVRGGIATFTEEIARATV